MAICDTAKTVVSGFSGPKIETANLFAFKLESKSKLSPELQSMLNSSESNYLTGDVAQKVFLAKCLEVAIFLIPSILMNETL